MMLTRGYFRGAAKRWATPTGVFSTLALVVACQSDAAPVEERTDTAAAAASTPPPLTLNLSFPATFALSRVAIAASGGVVLGGLDTVLAVDGSPGTVTSSGSGVTIGSGTRLGNVVSPGNIVLLPLGITATGAKSAGAVVVGPGDTVGTVAQGATLTPTVQRTITVPIPSGTPAEFLGVPGSSTLAPGVYDGVTLLPGAVVTLSAGTYVMNSFNLPPLAQLKLDTSGGSVNVYVKNTVLWNGSVSGDGTRFIFGYLGGLPLNLAGPFTGTALAPNAILNLGPIPNSYTGTFYGQEVVVAPGVTVRESATPFLAGSLTIAKTAACVGDSVEVTFDTSDAGPGATAFINGVAGNHQFVQLDGMQGPRQIFATVFTPDHRADSISETVTVQSCAPSPGAAPPVALHFWSAIGKPNTIELMVHDYDANGHEIPVSESATYSWSFGDGQTAVTTSPLVTHDYTASINPMNAFSYFTVAVNVLNASGQTSAKKVVPLWSLYAANRAKGVIQPPSTAAVSATTFALSLKNYEPTPLTITAANVELVPCDPALPSRPLPSQPLSVVIPAAATATVNVPPPGPFASDICSFGIHLLGTAAAGSVYADNYVQIGDNHLLQQAVADPSAIALLNQASTMTANPGHFDEFELRQLVAQGRLASLPAPTAAGSLYTNPGDTCNPGETMPGFICQPTADWVVNPPQVLNAYQGNFIMDHGCGAIGQLLGSIGQLYSHMSIVTKNRVEVRHSTANTDRITDSINYFTGLDPNKMQYGFPGTQGTKVYSIDQMTHFYCEVSPDGSGGKSDERNCNGNVCDCPSNSWEMSGELSTNPQTCANDTTPVPGLVVRPLPDAPASAIGVMQQAAAQALLPSGHYSFFMYSHADEATVVGNVPNASWASNTETTVCSSFARAAAVAAAPSGSLWPSTSRGQGVPDGMRLYSVDERVAAGTALHSVAYNQGTDSLACVVPGIDGICDLEASNAGNQLCNCFASDSCDDDGSSWRNPGTGIAVSPDDVNEWDTFKTGGTYGYSEPVVYVPTSFGHKYVWQPASTDGSMVVNVVDANGNPVPMADVIVNGILQGTTNATGQLTAANLPSGNADVEAQLYTGQSVPPPSPAPVADPESLPTCPATPCQDQGTSCPPGWLSPTNGCVQYGNCPDSCYTICACYPPPPPPDSCNFWFADRQTQITANASTTLQITLCTNTCQSSGQPGACQQRCSAQAPCDTGEMCQNSQCVPLPSATVTLSNIKLATTTDTGCTPPANQDSQTIVGENAQGQVVIVCNPVVNADGSLATSGSTVTRQLGCGDGHGAVIQVSCDGDGIPGDVAQSVTVTASLSDQCGTNQIDNVNASSVSLTDVLPGSPIPGAVDSCAPFTSGNACSNPTACPYNEFSANFTVSTVY